MKKKLLLVGLLGILIGLGLAYASEQLLIPTIGNFVGSVDLSADPDLIDWGDVTAETPVVRTVNITNVGSKDIVTLNMTHSNAVNIIDYTLTWDAEGLPLPRKTSIIANFTLTISDAIDGPISLDISIQE